MGLVVPLRSSSLRRRCHREPRVGARARAGRRAVAPWRRADRPRSQRSLERGRSDPRLSSGPDEDVHSFVERLLVERLGDAGRRLHTGRSRNEQVSLDLRLYLRRRIPAAAARRRRVVDALAAPGARRGRRADAGVHAFPSGAAGARRALLSRARRGAPARHRPARPRARDGGRRAAARLGRHRRHELRDRRRRARRAISASRASSPTASTHRPIATSRRRFSTRAR